jgi:hypothetical protein
MSDNGLTITVDGKTLLLGFFGGLTAGTGDVRGPTSSVDGDIALFSGVTGKLLKVSPVLVSAAGSITTPVGQLLNGVDITKLSGDIEFGASSVGTTTTTRYLYPGFANAQAQTSVISRRVSRAGTLRNLHVIQNTPAGNGNAIVYTLRVNGVASALTVSMASTASLGADLVNSVAVSVGDRIDIEVTKAAMVGGAPGDVVASMEFAS